MSAANQPAEQLKGPTLIVIEGADGTGSTTHTHGLATALSVRGHRARAWQHHRPAARDPWCVALDYATQRAKLLADHANENDLVLVVDRWWPTAHVEALCNPEGLDRSRFASLARAEALHSISPALVVVLDAPDAVLDARMAARQPPEVPDARDYARRKLYREQAEHDGRWWLPQTYQSVEPPAFLALNTGALKISETRARIVEAAMKVLGGGR
jgi:thymidylate kinase